MNYINLNINILYNFYSFYYKKKNIKKTERFIKKQNVYLK